MHNSRQRPRSIVRSGYHQDRPMQGVNWRSLGPRYPNWTEAVTRRKISRLFNKAQMASQKRRTPLSILVDRRDRIAEVGAQAYQWILQRSNAPVVTWWQIHCLSVRPGQTGQGVCHIPSGLGCEWTEGRHLGREWEAYPEIWVQSWWETYRIRILSGEVTGGQGQGGS